MIRRGLLSGLVAGAVLALVLLIVGEPRIEAAAAIEEPAHAPDVSISSGAQSFGGLVGAVLLGGAFGTVFAVVFVATRHVLPGRTEWSRAAALAGIAFVSLFLVPSMKYPAGLPGAGDSATAGERTGLYWLAVASSVAAVILAWRLTKALLERGLADHMGLPLGVALWAVIGATAWGLLPGAEPVASPPATWEFRVAAGVGGLLLWSVIGLLFGWLSERAAQRHDLPTGRSGRRDAMGAPFTFR